MEPSTPALIMRYAQRFNSDLLAGAHGVGSPLGAWLLLALVAPAATGENRATLEDTLGVDAVEASRRAAAMLRMAHPAVSTAVALWHRDNRASNAFAEWSTTLPAETEQGPVPTQEQADDWARRATREIIDTFPLSIDASTTFVLASALATRIAWLDPFGLADGSRLGGSWGALVEHALEAPAAHEQFIASTTQAGDVAVHAADSADALLVVSVIADESAAPADVHAAAHDVAIVLARMSSPTLLSAPTSAVKRSLFDLPLGDGHAWTIEEHRVRQLDSEPTESVTAVLPAWSAESNHDLLAAPSRPTAALGFTEAASALMDLCDHLGGPVDAAQAARARYGRFGFEAAAVTAFASRGAPPRRVKVKRRTAILRFNRPYAVVAIAREWGWHGIPVFSVWVARPEEVGSEIEPSTEALIRPVRDLPPRTGR